MDAGLTFAVGLVVGGLGALATIGAKLERVLALLEALTARVSRLESAEDGGRRLGDHAHA
jgi:hypothetical protein